MATRYARSMVRHGFFSHTSPGGATLLDRVRAVGYGGRRVAAGEALAWAQGRLATPRAIVRAWMASPPHRAVLLGRGYRDVGVGVALGTPYGGATSRSATYAADFGSSALGEIRHPMRYAPRERGTVPRAAWRGPLHPAGEACSR